VRLRTFEVLILSTLFLRLIGFSFPPIKRLRWVEFLPCLMVLLTGIHLVAEKPRWQMVPAYGVTILLFLLSLLQLKRGSQRADKRPSRPGSLFIGFLLRLLVFAFVAALPILLPVFRLPEPTGPHPVGTTKLYLVDRTRPEAFTQDPYDSRELVVRVWYPAKAGPRARRAPLMEQMPFQFSHLSLVRTHAYVEAPVSDAQTSYPVLIFSHGHVAFIEQNLTQMEELASQGYIVFSMAHPYHTIVTVFADGRAVPADRALADALLKGDSPTGDVYAEHLAIWTDDTRFLIDELERIQAGERESMLVGKLDMGRLGVFGQSFGGVTAVQVCAVDDRCRAGISLDSGLPREYTGRRTDSPPKEPFMFMLNEGRAHYVRTALGAVDNTAYGVVVRGTTHYDFTDLFL
jgi:predicted dienelactone hydrolase